jgi:hypothetical protein
MRFVFVYVNGEDESAVSRLLYMLWECVVRGAEEAGSVEISRAVLWFGEL